VGYQSGEGLSEGDLSLQGTAGVYGQHYTLAEATIAGK
jgi:hypothetical protein